MPFRWPLILSCVGLALLPLELGAQASEPYRVQLANDHDGGGGGGVDERRPRFSALARVPPILHRNARQFAPDGGRGARGFGERFFVPGEILSDVPSEAFLGSLAVLGFSLLERAPLPALRMEVARLGVPEGLSEDAAISLIGSNFPGVVADLNSLYQLASGGWPSGDYPFAFAGWPEERADCGKGVRLAMLDTAVRPQLLGGSQAKLTLEDFAPPSGLEQGLSHGSSVAALLVGSEAFGLKGLVPGVERLYAANIFERDDKGRDLTNLLRVMRGLDWSLRQQPQVLNLSIAGEGNRLLKKAIAEADKGRSVIIVAAAGNGGAGSPPLYPAAYAEVIAATAVDERRAIYHWANRGDYVEFAAPGVDVPVVTQDGLRAGSGTSFAAPFVTAALARLLGGPDRDAVLADPRAQLRALTRDLGRQGRDEIFGWGLVEVGGC